MPTPSPFPRPDPLPGSGSGLEADLLLDRRRLKRSRGWWRGAAVLLVLLGIGMVLARNELLEGAPSPGSAGRTCCG
ncbi:hypothetical protein ACE7GA_11985 [Roseomonas sp. CCTCC AB2023176]|uniref:hypothetical protein n=1 Tax=Roseomonas sp. CCTCC AB2023176 TaxID=3342640 RepID=UPI0035DC9D32